MSAVNLTRISDVIYKVKQEALNDNVSFVIGNESCDLDSIACTIAYAYYLCKKGYNAIPVFNISARVLRNKAECVYMLNSAGLTVEDLICKEKLEGIIEVREASKMKSEFYLVDHHKWAVPSIKQPTIIGIIDHRPFNKEKIILDRGIQFIEPDCPSCSLLVGEICDYEVKTFELLLQAALIDSHVKLFKNEEGWKAFLENKEYEIGKENKPVRTNMERMNKLANAAKTDECNPVFWERIITELLNRKNDMDGKNLDQILALDYKTWPIETQTEEGVHYRPETIGMSTIPIDFEEFISKNGWDNVVRDLKEALINLKIDTLILGCQNFENKESKRQLIIISRPQVAVWFNEVLNNPEQYLVNEPGQTTLEMPECELKKERYLHSGLKYMMYHQLKPLTRKQWIPIFDVIIKAYYTNMDGIVYSLL